MTDKVLSKVLISTTGKGLARAATNADGHWSVESVLEGRDVRSLATDPLHSNVVYAGTQGEGLFRSDDRGQTWSPAGMGGEIVKSIAVSPHSPGVIYAGTKPAGVWLTRDSGDTWSELEAFQKIRGRRFWRSPAEPPDWRAYVQALAISPEDPGVLVAGIEFGAVVRTDDGGRTWSNHRKGAIRDCHNLTFHSSDGDWVYQAGASLAGAAVSRDGGISWRQPKSGLEHHYGWTCAADPERPEVWYLSAGPYGWKGEPQAHVDGHANAAIYRSAGGAPWERLSGGLPQPLTHLAYALQTDPGAPGHLYAGLSSGEVWHTADYGDSWEKLPFNLGRIYPTMIVI